MFVNATRDWRAAILEGINKLHLITRHGNLVPMDIHGVLPYIQVILSVLLIACVLLQQTGASMGGAFGGDNFTAGFHTRRGLERTLFIATIVLGILFAASAFLALIIK